MKKIIIAVLLFVMLTLVACGPTTPGNNNNQGGNNDVTDGAIVFDGEAFGVDLNDLGAYNGLFEVEGVNVEINCVSGTPGCYKIEGNTVIFSGIKADSVYSISGHLLGNIVIAVNDAYNFELEMCGLSIISDSTHPVSVMGGNEVTIQAKKSTKNYIYDKRAVIPEDDISSISGAIYSEVDLEISGKGEMFVVSYNNNGIHSKKDLQVKNLSLVVSCKDNALKGNDSLELENASARLVATAGDCIKTSNSDISNKGNQRGTVSILGGRYDVFAASDGIDAAYNVDITSGNLSIYTAKYSNPSGSTSVTSSKGIKAHNEIFIRGGNIDIKSFDDAVYASADTPLENGKNPSGAVNINGGEITIYTDADGLRADGRLNVRGGKTVILSTTDGHSAIAADDGYSYSAGILVGVMPEGEAADKATDCITFNLVGSEVKLSIASGNKLTCNIGSDVIKVKISMGMSARVVMLGSPEATANVE